MNDQNSKINVDFLRNDGGAWLAQSFAMDKITEVVRGLRLTRVEAGAYQIMFDPYDKLVVRVDSLSVEGSKVMRGIRDVLRGIADDVQAADEEAARRINAARQRED